MVVIIKIMPALIRNYEEPEIYSNKSIVCNIFVKKTHKIQILIKIYEPSLNLFL